MWPLSEDDYCTDHVRIYDEDALHREYPEVIWKCLKCNIETSDETIDEVTYRYDQIMRGK